jgi:ATP-dependent Clp protease ATP-binding subunit ClpB
MEVVGQHFRPEFLNRIDEVVVFHPLGREHIRRIVDLQVEILRQRLAAREIGLVLTDAALDWLGEVGYDPVYGARPLKRALQQHLENALARDLLQGRFAPEDTIAVDREADHLVFRSSAH